MKQNNRYWVAFLLLVAIFAIAPLAESVGAFSWDSVRYTYSKPTQTTTIEPTPTPSAAPTLTPRGVDRITEPYCGGTAKSCANFKSITCHNQDGCTAGGFGTCKGTPKACNTYAAEASCESQKGCLWILPTCIDSDNPKTVTLDVGQQTTFFCNIVKLNNINSGPIIVDVDGVTETVTGTETVYEIRITVVGGTYAENIADRSAILRIGSTEYEMNVGDTITASGKKITLKNVGSAISSAEVMVNFINKSIVKTISGTETINNINIEVVSTQYYESYHTDKDTQATLTLS